MAKSRKTSKQNSSTSPTKSKPVTKGRLSQEAMPQFWIGSGKSGNPSDGVFETTFNVGWPILAVASVRVCEGKPFQEHNGDAVFELQAIDLVNKW
jgi:hypothetical protein